jgi:hypothetical protein
MMASSSLERIMCAHAWLLDAEFDVAEHPQLANPDSDTNHIFHIFPEYLLRCVDGSAGYLAERNDAHFFLNTYQPDLSTHLKCCAGDWRISCQFMARIWLLSRLASR